MRIEHDLKGDKAISDDVPAKTGKDIVELVHETKPLSEKQRAMAFIPKAMTGNTDR